MGGLWSKDEPRSKAEPPQGIIYSNFISILDEYFKKNHMSWNIDWKSDNCYIWMTGHLHLYCLTFFSAPNKDKTTTSVIEFPEASCHEYMFDSTGK